MVQWEGTKGITEASSLGFAPGQWPSELSLTVEGKKVLFVRAQVNLTGIELCSMSYVTTEEPQRTLLVLND